MTGWAVSFSTEFHDVINEFNGYYRIDNSEKDFGYGGEVPGMGVADLHASDFLAWRCAAHANGRARRQPDDPVIYFIIHGQ